VSFRVDAFPDATFSGEVWQVRLAPVTAQNVVTYTIIVRANNPGGRLLPGMTANLDIITGDHRGVLLVSNEALRFTPRGSASSLIETAAPSAAASTPRPASVPALNDTGDVVAGLQRALGLDDQTVARIRTALASANGNARTPQAARPAGAANSGGGGGNAQAAR